MWGMGGLCGKGGLSGEGDRGMGGLVGGSGGSGRGDCMAAGARSRFGRLCLGPKGVADSGYSYGIIVTKVSSYNTNKLITNTTHISGMRSSGAAPIGCAAKTIGLAGRGNSHIAARHSRANAECIVRGHVLRP